MKFLEKDLEDIIYETNNNILQDRGLDIYGKLYRQKVIGNYGIADLISFYRYYDPYRNTHEIEITVFELKKEIINFATFLQALTYVKGIKRFLGDRNIKYDITYRVICIGKVLDTSNSYLYLPDIINGEFFQIHNYTYDYEFDGIKFYNHAGYKLTNEGF